MLKLVLFWHPKRRHELNSDVLSLLAPECVGIDRSELRNSVFYLEYGKMVTVVCSLARLVQGASTKRIYPLPYFDLIGFYWEGFHRK